jgi:hypothetical protein
MKLPKLTAQKALDLFSSSSGGWRQPVNADARLQPMDHGNCTDTVYDNLNNAAAVACLGINPTWFKCRDTNTCSELIDIGRANEACFQARKKINDQCFAGADIKGAQQFLNTSMQCFSAYERRCQNKPW